MALTQKVLSLHSLRYKDLFNLPVILYNSTTVTTQTTGQPKGIQHGVSYLRYMIHSLTQNSRTRGISKRTLITTCFFHVGGFLGIFELMGVRKCFVFNYGNDLDQGDTCELIYRWLFMTKKQNTILTVR